MSCPSHLVLAKLKVDVNIHRAIVGAHLMKDAFLCKAHFFTVIKLIQSKRFNRKLLGIRRWVRVGFSFSFLTVSVLMGGKLYDLLEFN